MAERVEHAAIGNFLDERQKIGDEPIIFHRREERLGKIHKNLFVCQIRLEPFRMNFGFSHRLDQISSESLEKSRIAPAIDRK